MPLKTDVLILGGGLAGLSTAYHLNGASGLSSLVVEKKPAPGGTAGSIVKDGFTFDLTGHLLHLHDPYGKSLIESLLAGNLIVRQRSSWIYSRGVYTRYPFQANTYGLPERVAEDCALEFLRTVHRPDRAKQKDPSFKEWCLKNFGTAISRNFMFPYNEKLWHTQLEHLTTQWQGRFVPKPKASEVLRGALLEQPTAFGYNAIFRYPKRGGSQALADALAARLRPEQLRLCAPVTSVDLRERVAQVQGLGEVAYTRLVNTLPLNDFIALAAPWPRGVLEAADKLRCNSVYCLNLGVLRAKVSDKHWIYFPEKHFPFYRVGFYSNFSDAAAPRNASALYIEVSAKSREKPNLKGLEHAAIDALVSCGLLKRSDAIAVKLWTPIRCAYVVYDFNRDPAVKLIFDHFRKIGLESIGRYGAWKYSFMEETILDGKRCSERLAGRGELILDKPLKSHEELRPLK